MERRLSIAGWLPGLQTILLWISATPALGTSVRDPATPSIFSPSSTPGRFHLPSVPLRAGRDRDFMVATQLEYRLTLPKPVRTGWIRRLGRCSAGPEQFRFAYFLPDIGAGLRYELSTKYHVNLRLDVAPGGWQPHLGHGGWRGVLNI
jgi:hypothetical protein